MVYRIEAESQTPSRSDVLSQAEAARRTTHLEQKQMSLNEDNSCSESVPKSIRYVDVTKTLHDPQPKEQPSLKDLKSDAKTNSDGERNEDCINRELRCSKNQLEAKKYYEFQSKTGLKDDNDKSKHTSPNSTYKKGQDLEDSTNGKKRLPYLSKHNLEVHDKMLREAWMQLVDEDKKISDSIDGHSKTIKQSETEPNIPKATKHKGKEMADDISEPVKIKNIEGKRHKLKRRVFQRSTDFIYQKSKANTYSTLHERKQNYSHQSWKKRVVKSKSNDELHRVDLINESIVDGFEKEKIKLLKMRTANNITRRDVRDDNEEGDRSNFIQRSQQYFTRDTAERYKTTKDDIVPTKSERKDSQRQTVRSTMSKADTNNTKNKRTIIDTEREDQYMMDMDYLVNEREEKLRQLDINTVSEGEEIEINKSITKSETSRFLRRERLLKLTASKKVAENEGGNKERAKAQMKRNSVLENIYQSKAATKAEMPKANAPLKTHQFAADHDTAVEQKVTRFVNKIDRYRALERSLRPKRSKYSFNGDLGKTGHDSFSDNKKVLSYNDIKSQMPFKYGEAKHYSLDALIHLPRTHKSEANGYEHEGDTVNVLAADIVRQRLDDIQKPLKENNNTFPKLSQEYIHEDKLNHKQNTQPFKILKNSSSHDNTNTKNKDDLQQTNLKEREDNYSKLTSENVNLKVQTHRDFTVEDRDSSKTEYADENLADGNDRVTEITHGTGHKKSNTDMDLAANNMTHYEAGASMAKKPPLSATTAEKAPLTTALEKRIYSKSQKSSRAPTRKTFKTYTITQPKKLMDNLSQSIPKPKAASLSRTSGKHVLYSPRSRRTIKTYESSEKQTAKENEADIQGVLKEGKTIEEKAIVSNDNQDQHNALEPNDVVVKDKIRLEIGIINQEEKPVDPEQIEQEKKKIKRFWEVVGGKDVNDETLYSVKDSPRKDKVLVAKVTKERVMSAKSKSSKKSKISSIHNVGGNYSLTLEVT